MRLSRAGIPSPPDESRILLAEALGVSLSWVMAHPEAEVPAGRCRAFLSYIHRRAAFEPVAYVVGHREFYGLDLLVNPAVLIPRPETELLVERAVAASNRLVEQKDRDLLAVDLGTGSGALAIAIAANQRRVSFIAIDSSTRALEVARQNLLQHGLEDRIRPRQGDLLEGVEERFDLLVANLPYIPSGDIAHLMVDVARYEPHEALDGGPDGMGPTRRALEQAVERLEVPATLLFEIGDKQGRPLAKFAKSLYPNARIEVRRDYAGFERILSVDTSDQ